MTPRNLKLARKRLGLKQTEFAELLSVTASLVTKLERGVATITPRVEMHVRLLMDKHLEDMRAEIDALFEESE